MAFLNIAELVEQDKGATLETVLSMEALNETENLDVLDVVSEKMNFEYDSEKEAVRLRVEGREQPINVDIAGYVKAMRMASFPKAVAEKYPASLMIPPLNYGFKTNISRTKAFLKKSGDLVAFTKPSLEFTSTKRLIELGVETLGGPGNVLFDRLDHSLEFTNCSMILIDQVRDFDALDKGDIVYGGVNWTNSLMGEFPLTVSATIYKVACRNGLISSEHAMKYSRNTEGDGSHLDWFANAVKGCAEAVVHEFDKVQSLRGVMLEEGFRQEIIGNIFAEFGMSNHHRTMVMEHLMRNPPSNMWDVVNAITAVANHEDIQDSPQTVRKLQQIGGELASRTVVCPACHAVKRE